MGEDRRVKGHTKTQAQVTGKRKGHRFQRLGYEARSKSREAFSLTCPRYIPEEVQQADGGAWSPGEEGDSWLPWSGSLPWPCSLILIAAAA